MGFAAEFLTSIGGATIILFALSKYLGNVWAERIARQTIHKFEVEIQALRSSSETALEQVRALNQLNREERNSFHQLSQKTYQDFFEKRLHTYKNLLALQHKYITETGEDFLVEDIESWGDAYLSHYKALNDSIGEQQLYISADLDDKFSLLRDKHNEIYRTNEREVAYMQNAPEQGELASQLNNSLYGETYDLYEDFREQLKEDVKRLRSRIDLDMV